MHPLSRERLGEGPWTQNGFEIEIVLPFSARKCERRGFKGAQIRKRVDVLEEIAV